MAFHAGIHMRPEAGLENNPVDLTTGPTNYIAEDSSLPKHMFSPSLKPRRTFRERAKLIKNLQLPMRHLPEFKRKDNMSKHVLFQADPSSDATHPEKPVVSQITAGLRSESAGDSRVVLPVRLKEDSGSMAPNPEPSRNLELPDLKGMQSDEGADGDMQEDTREELVPQDVDTPTTGNGSPSGGLSPLIMTPGPDEPEDMETSQSPILDSGLIQDVCEQILRQAFDTEYDDIAHTDAAVDAYNTVSYCLDELSRILPDDSLFNSAICIQDLPRGAGHLAPARQEGSGSNSGMGRCGGANNGSQKRPNDDGNGYPSRRPEDGFSSGDRGFGGGNNDGGNKRARMTTESEGQGLSCPFRKRNPLKFNIRDHQQCAVRPFDDMTHLKRHIKDLHKQKTGSVYHCPRCKEEMQSREALDAHIAVPNDRICSPQEGSASGNPEDGITGRVEYWLNNRKANAKIDNWESLWRILFPSDDVVPEPDFVAPVEREEFYGDLKNARPQLIEILTLNGELSLSESQRSDRQHMEQLADIFYGHVGQVFQNSRRQPMNLVRRWKSGKRNPKAENPNPASLISPAMQRQGRGQDQLTVPRPIVKKQATTGDGYGGSLASSLETINSAKSWANVGQAELMATRATRATRAAPGLTGSGNVQSGQVQFAQTGAGVIASPLGLRQDRQPDFFATRSPVNPRTPVSLQAGFDVYGNGVGNSNQPAQVTAFHHGRQDLVDPGIEMVNHCPPAQGMNGLNNIHRVNIGGVFGSSPQPQHSAYQQQPGHMALANPDDAQMPMREMYASNFDWGLNSSGVDLLQQQYQGGHSTF
ncbi:hypothetical protein SMACR_04117 [Sordaria macrospora]|uniref:WGS project CABT00000000 data, contig 2.15 n=3 Tax=Sordaria macrospora TaxID=5147 RepID=F7VZD8_SORMK|nr:uncharacterized protein SMAC_04117 [Sordaria macrospora k-hell]KAA8628691.1 hypothetical protein SMACR_04117 [Sordaria macrospora]KAH7635936.1 hypothetical protein B0T09DRAFT_354311 [Sordaria sp. MPI-SDFR-AT-0083]CCC10886.1 unnamed protein product [Sordaria macrospora k-hell]